MKISEMIKNLEEFKAEYGDIECWYATDDEGNDYHKVYFTPSICWVDSDGDIYTNTEDLEEYDLTIRDVTPVCIVN